MSYKVSYVSYGNLCYAVPLLVEQLQKSELWTRGRATMDDIVRFLYIGQMQLWAVYDSETLSTDGYAITEIKQYPQCKMLVIQYGAGVFGTLSGVGDLIFDMMERFAKDSGCAGIEFFGRPGWGPHAKKHGYTVKTVVYEKYFNEVQP
jgi:hypothetical protein